MYSKPPTATERVTGWRRFRRREAAELDSDTSKEARDELAEPDESYSCSLMCSVFDLIDVYSVCAAIDRTSQLTFNKTD